MPDVGTPRPTPRPVTSHVSTTEWQSFEGRMRRRRAERCVLRAEEALAAGHADDARAALDEARGLLAPGETPTFEELRARVAGRSVMVTPAAPERRRTRWPAAAAVLAITATLVGVGVYSQLRVPAGDLSVATGVPVETPASRVEAPPAAPSAVISHETVRAVATTPSEGAARSEPGPSTEPATVGPVRVSLTSTPLPVPTSGQDALPTVIPETPAPLVAPPPPAPPPVAAEMPRAGAGAPLETLASSPAASAPVVPVTEVPAAAPAPVAAEPRIRAVLSAYEAAFTSLDAGAARSVWPSVDERALSRAFDGLSSQSISLGGCAINVQGDTATARCTGNATWAPKVGGGARTAARRWEFALEKTGAAWQIVRADVR